RRGPPGLTGVGSLRRGRWMGRRQGSWRSARFPTAALRCTCACARRGTGSLLRSAVELRPEKRRRRLQNVVGSAQLSVLTLQPLQLRQLVARGPSPATGITLGLANPVPHRLRCRTQLLGHRRDRFPLRPVLMLMIEHHPHRPLTQLGRVSPMSWHNSILPKERSLHKTRGDSPRRRPHSCPWTRTYALPL